MGDTTKILSVSYGTFSCRLEGFDDSVETMKTIVSYFHELAGHDRFMDMEPQAPDMDTLARLAEDQTGAPVEVEADGGHVSLRVAHDSTEERPSLRLRPRPEAAAPAMAGDDMSTPDEDQYEDEIAAEDDADDLVATAEDQDDDLDADDMHDDDMLAAGDDDLEEIDADADVAEDSDDVVAEDDDDAPYYDAEAKEAEADDSVAAKLQRIRAVVSRGHMTGPLVSPAEADAEAGDKEEDDGAASKPTGADMLAQRLAALAGANASRHDDAADADDDDGIDDEIAADDAASAEDDLTEDDVPEVAQDDTDDETGPVTTPLVLTPTALAEDEEDGDDDFEFVEEEMEADAEEMAQGEDDDDLTDSDADDVSGDELALRRLNRSKRADLPENDDDAMTRIMSQADEKLNEPEGRRHRDAFAQLKAAVAATEAARQLGDAGGSKAEASEVFRDDLGAHEATEDKTGSRPLSTPLKLVASQRVEGEYAPLDPAADRLRQIAAKKEGGGSSQGGFAEFAREKGATELSDLLEAAAAYIAFVEGDDDFSRPQVMKKVQMAASDQFSREDGLRSFGRLLRQSKIIKLNNGRFQVAEDTRFRPDNNKAAQG